MKRFLSTLGLISSLGTTAQDHPHYTMFMYNKMLYNPGYTGSRNALSINAMYRNQWSGIPGAPTGINLAVDGTVGRYTEEFHPMALGVTLNRETTGPVDNTTFNAYYAYRIRLESSTVSIGLQGGATMYNARYSELDAYDNDDLMLQQDVSNAILPNFGTGVYWYARNHYLGVSAPNILQNYYDKNQRYYPGGKMARQIRSYFLSGGYNIPVNEELSLLPQFIARYSGDGTYQLPFSADINLTAIIRQRVMIGATYRTDQSVQGIVHVQVAKKLNLGYAYDYILSDFGRYARGAHEITIGFDFLRDTKDYIDPRFINNF